ncbi:MAG: hypothetical protein IKW02_03655 [Clostridia bacterium]|nr:hypothetical protein [Clostridia bacterium]
MNWPRVKTILIFMFLLVDIILVASIVAPALGLSRIPQKTIENTVAVLKARGIEISPEIIPNKRESLGVAELYNLWTDREMLARKILGDDAKQEGEGYKNDTKSLKLNQTDFVYENSEPEKNIAQELINVGIDARENIYEQGEKTLRVWQAVEDKKIFESEIYAAFDGDVINASGYWIFSERDKGIIKNTPDKLLDVTGVLVDFANNPIHEERVKIAAVEIGYSTGGIYRDTAHKLVSVSPAYKISTDTGDYYMYDAFSGGFLYAIKNGEIIY